MAACVRSYGSDWPLELEHIAPPRRKNPKRQCKITTFHSSYRALQCTLLAKREFPFSFIFKDHVRCVLIGNDFPEADKVGFMFK